MMTMRTKGFGQIEGKGEQAVPTVQRVQFRSLDKEINEGTNFNLQDVDMNLGTLYDIFLNFVFNKIFKIKNLSHPLMMVSAFGLYLGSEMVKYRKGTISSNE